MSTHLSRLEARKLFAKPQKKRNKFNANGHYDIDGVYWHSDREEERWHVLKLRERRGEIAALRRQVKFTLDVCGIRIGSWTADFVYQDVISSEWVIEDSKSKATKTPLYKRSKLHFQAQYKMLIIEV